MKISITIVIKLIQNNNSKCQYFNTKTNTIKNFISMEKNCDFLYKISIKKI